MSNAPSLADIQKVKLKAIDAFQRWLVLPERLLHQGLKAKHSSRDGMCALIEKTWHKLKQDISAFLALVGTNHIGPAVAMLRICREQALWMVMWAFADPKDDGKLRHYYYDVRRRKNAQRLKRAAQSFLDSQGIKFSDMTLRRLRDAVKSADEMISHPDSIAWTGDVDKDEIGFPRLARVAAESLAQALISADLVADQVVDHWIECEAVHGGSNALALYEPTDVGLDLERNGELTALSRLRDLYQLTVMVNGSILRVTGLDGKLPRPTESAHLAAVAHEVEVLVVQNWPPPEPK